MRTHQRLLALALCLVLTAVSTATSAGAAASRQGLITTGSGHGRLAAYYDSEADEHEVVLVTRDHWDDHVGTQTWVFTHHDSDETYTIGLPGRDLCWHREGVQDRIRVRLGTCSAAKSARWLLDPIEPGPDGTDVVAIRPLLRQTEALTLGSPTDDWHYVVLRHYDEQDTQHWKVPFKVGAGS